MEHQNHTTKQIICVLIHEGIDNWVEVIPLVELCVNNTVADSTGVSPTALTYGWSLRMPVDHLDGWHPNQLAQTTVEAWH